MKKIKNAVFAVVLALYGVSSFAQSLNLGSLEANKGQVADLFRRGDQLLSLRIEGMNSNGLFLTAGIYKVYQYNMNNLSSSVSSNEITGAEAKAAGYNYVFTNIYSSPSGKPFVMLYSQGNKDANAKVTVIPLTDDFSLDVKNKVDVYSSKKLKEVAVDGFVVENYSKNKYLAIHVKTTTTKKNPKTTDRPSDEVVFLDDHFKVVKRVEIPHNTMKSDHDVLLVSASDYIYTFSGEAEKDGWDDARFSRYRADVENPVEDVIISEFPTKTIGRRLAYKYFDNKVVIGGTTYEGKTDVDGYFIYTIDDVKGMMINKAKYEFGQELVAKFFTKKVAANPARSKKAPLSFRINHIDFDKNGDMIVFGERFYKVLICNKYNCYYLYHNCDIMVTKISKEGKVLWANAINRHVISFTDGYDNGYMSAVSSKSGDVYVYYSDIAKNLTATNVETTKQAFYSKVSDLFMVKFDANTGETTKEGIYNYGKDKIQLVTKGIEDQGLTDKVFFYLNGKHKERIADMDLE